MRLAVLTSLYPSPPLPVEGVFAERRWLGMRARGHEVRVVQPLPRVPGAAARLLRGRWRALAGCPESELRAGIPVARPRYLHVPRLALPNARRFARAGLDELLSAGAPDAVVCDYAWPAAMAAPELARRGVPCLVSGRGSDVLQVAGEANLGAHLARCLRAAGHWCAVSEHLLAAMDELGGGRGTLVPNGVDPELFRPRDRAAARRELGLPADGALVLVAGHLIPRKDPRLALAAFALVAAERAGARLAFVGDGPLARELERDVLARGLAARVTFAGVLPPERLALWYAACDALLLTSRREGRPNVVLEALASGRPAVATAAGGTGELLRGLPEPLRAEPSREPERLAARLRAALDDPPAPEELARAVRPLSWEAGLAALEGALERAVAARARGGAA